MKKIIQVPETLTNERIDRVISMIVGISRGQVQDLLKQHMVFLNKKEITKASYRVATNDLIEIEFSEQFNNLIKENTEVPLEVVYLDKDLIVINKQAGQVMHPGMGKEKNSIASGLIAHFPEIKSVGEPDRPGIVHRLDKMTSGLVVVARTQQCYEALVDLIKQRKIKRSYIALVEGVMANKKGVIEAPIGRSLTTPGKMDILLSGKPARSKYEILAKFREKQLTLVELELDTGRTHQLRVHLSSIGHPIVGDYTYGAKIPNIKRTFLHSYLLRFMHPITNKEINLKIDLPDDLKIILNNLTGKQYYF
jgi:23S rRNA pseudouridine1911/1915/1917 synthase